MLKSSKYIFQFFNNFSKVPATHIECQPISYMQGLNNILDFTCEARFTSRKKYTCIEL